MQIRQFRGFSTVDRVVGQLTRSGSPRVKISESSVEALKMIASQRPELSRGLLQRIVAAGFERKITRVTVPALLAESQNLPVLRRLAGDSAYLSNLIDIRGERRKLDLSGAHLREKPGYNDLTAEFRERKFYDKMHAILGPDSLAAVGKDSEIGDLALFNSLWQARVMIYEAQYLRRALLESAKKGESLTRDLAWEEEANHRAASLVGYARSFMLELAGGFPFGNAAYRKELQRSIGRAAEQVVDSNLGAADAVFVSLTQRLERICEQKEAARLRRERYAVGKQPAGPARLTLAEYGITISAGGIWTIPRNVLRAAGTVLRRQIGAAHTNEPDVLRQAQDQIDSIAAERARNLEVIAYFRTFCIDKPVREVKLDQAILAGVLETYQLGQVVPKVEARLLIGLARDLLDVAGYSATIEELSPARERLVKFCCTMLTVAVRQLEKRNADLDRQLRCLGERKEVMEETAKRRAARHDALQQAGVALTAKITEESCLAGPERIDRLREEAIAAYRAIQDAQDLETGLAEGKRHLAKFIAAAGELAKLNRAKQRQLSVFRSIQAAAPTSAIEPKALAGVAELNTRIMIARRSLIGSLFYLRHHVANRFSAETPEGPALASLESEVEALWARQEIVMKLGAGFVLKSDLCGLTYKLPFPEA